NWGKPDQTICLEETLWLKDLEKEKTVNLKIVQQKTEGIIEKTNSLKFNVLQVLSEQQIMNESSSGYLRLYVPDHLAPSSEHVDDFIYFVLKLPIGAWIHFHCAAGNGRTTTFMAIYDMMHNAKKVSLDDIILRQHLLGGANLFHSYDPLFWKFPYAKERELFLRQFYEYALKNTDCFKTSWSSFLKEKTCLREEK